MAFALWELKDSLCDKAPFKALAQVVTLLVLQQQARQHLNAVAAALATLSTHNHRGT
jgi:hypothetical protein